MMPMMHIRAVWMRMDPGGVPMGMGVWAGGRSVMVIIMVPVVMCVGVVVRQYFVSMLVAVLLSEVQGQADDEERRGDDGGDPRWPVA